MAEATLSSKNQIVIPREASEALHVRPGDKILVGVERPGNAAVTSTITMTELLVRPCRDSDERRADEFYALLSTMPSLERRVPTLRSRTSRRVSALAII